MSSPAEKKCSICTKLGLKSLTKQNVISFYLPAQGVISYTALSVNVMNPTLVLRVFPRRDITNVLLVNAIIGSGLYLYSSKHLSPVETRDRIILSAFGAATFCLGSVLMWALFRSILPENIPLCTLVGVSTSCAMIKIGKKYVEHVDALAEM